MTEGADWRMIFGLEGPVLDPQPGLLASLRRALADVERPAPVSDDLSWTLDADCAEAIRKLLGPDGRHLESAVAERFRDHYERDGRFAGRVHASMARVLDTLAGRSDIETVLVSAYPRDALQRQLSELGLARSFDAVACPRQRSCARCRRALAARVARDGQRDHARTIWLSDDPNDLATASRQAITAMAALWGRSTAEELAPAAPDLWARTPDDLVALLWADGPDLSQRRPH